MKNQQAATLQASPLETYCEAAKTVAQLATEYRKPAEEMLREALANSGENCLQSFVVGLTVAKGLMAQEPELSTPGTISIEWETLKAVQAVALKRQLDLERYGSERLMIPPFGSSNADYIPGLSFRSFGAIPACGVFLAKNPAFKQGISDYFDFWEFAEVYRTTPFGEWKARIIQAGAEPTQVSGAPDVFWQRQRSEIWVVEGSFSDITIQYPDPVSAVVDELPPYIRQKLKTSIDDEGYLIWTWNDSLRGYTEEDDRRRGHQAQRTKSMLVISLVNDSLKRCGLELSPTGHNDEQVWGRLSLFAG